MVAARVTSRVALGVRARARGGPRVRARLIARGTSGVRR
jgi:hypothetical protein